MSCPSCSLCGCCWVRVYPQRDKAQGELAAVSADREKLKVRCGKLSAKVTTSSNENKQLKDAATKRDSEFALLQQDISNLVSAA